MEENHSNIQGGDDSHPTGLDIDKLSCFLTRQIRNSTPVKIVEAFSTVAEGGISTNTRRVTATCILRSGKKKKYSIIVKTPVQWKTDIQTKKFSLVFRTEIRSYTIVLPAMEALMDEFDDKRDKLWPVLYGVENDLIAIEDLAESQFRLRDRKKNLDLPHAMLALRGLARWHAMSMELLRRRWIGENEKGKWKPTDDQTLSQLWKALTVSLSNAMVNNWGEEWQPIGKKLMTHKDDMLVKYHKEVPNYDRRFEVFNHGDLNSQNMMFKYTEYGDHPVAVKFFDLQYPHLNSFVWDLSYLLNVSVDPAVRRDNLAEFFTHYVESLQENLRFFNYVGYVPTLDDVKTEWERISYAHMCHLLFNTFRSAETEHPFHYAKIIDDSPEDFVDKFFDLQYSHLNSFIWDLSYLLNGSVHPAVRRDNLAEFISHYVESLQENLRFFNYVGYVPTLDDVKTEWERISYAHMCHLWLNTTMSAESEHPFNYAEIMNDSPEDVVDKSVFSDGKVERNFGDDLKYFYSNGIM